MCVCVCVLRWSTAFCVCFKTPSLSLSPCGRTTPCGCGQEERDRVARDLVQPLVEEWAEQALEFTSLYGVREYYRGSELRMHVDRVATHVFSVIMNLHQVQVEES